MVREKLFERTLGQTQPGLAQLKKERRSGGEGGILQNERSNVQFYAHFELVGSSHLAIMIADYHFDYHQFLSENRIAHRVRARTHSHQTHLNSGLLEPLHPKSREYPIWS